MDGFFSPSLFTPSIFRVLLSSLLLFFLSACSRDGRAPSGRACERAERFGSPAMERLVHMARLVPHWIGKTHKFWYLREVRGGRSFVLVDGDEAEKGPAFDHARLAALLSKALHRPVDPAGLPFRSVRFLPGGRSLTFRTGGKNWVLDLDHYSLVERTDREASSPRMERALPSPPVQERRGGKERTSPDGKWVAFVSASNIHLRSRGKKAGRALSRDGSPSDGYTSLLWFPDSKGLVAFRTVPAPEKEMFTLEVRPADSVRPRLHKQVYPLPGDPLPVHRIRIFRVPSGRSYPVKAGPIDWQGPPAIYWESRGRFFFYVRTWRGYKRRALVRVDSLTGEAKLVIDERSRTNLPPMKAFHSFLQGGRRVLWASERDGWNHLYLFDGETGRLVRQVTRGNWVVRGVQRVDGKRGEVWFSAGGMEPGRDPYFLHFYRIGLDGKRLVSLTPADGDHRIQFSPDRSLYLDRWSRVDRPPVTELRRSSDGSLVLTLEEADDRDLRAAGVPPPEPFAAPGRDGRTMIYGVIWRPSRLDPSRKYPVVEHIYAGPQDSYVPKSFRAAWKEQALAELGFVVVMIDGMGTSNRSKAFQDVSYKNLADSGFPDRIAWMKAAARTRPWMDLTRVGIYGVSAGGYNAARALIDHPEFYKVAVSASGNHDHRTDKVWWNELWMGFPPGPWYKAQSNVECAARLKGRLLLIHGLRDTNVNPFASTFQFVQALIREGKDFDLLVVPDAGHGMGGPYGRRRMWNWFVENLLGVEPPPGFPKGGPGGPCSVVMENRSRREVAIYWLPPSGGRKKYFVLAPGAKRSLRSFLGHRWIAVADGETVSRYTVTRKRRVWAIR